MQGWRAAAPAAARDEAGASTLPLPRRAPAPRSATRTPARQRSRAAANRPPSATSVPPVAALRVGDVFTPRSCARARAGTTALASAATPMPAPDTPRRYRCFRLQPTAPMSVRSRALSCRIGGRPTRTVRCVPPQPRARVIELCMLARCCAAAPPAPPSSAAGTTDGPLLRQPPPASPRQVSPSTLSRTCGRAAAAAAGGADAGRRLLDCCVHLPTHAAPLVSLTYLARD